MCGIIFASNAGKGSKPVNEWVVNQLQDQLHRGKEGFGIAFVDSKTKKVFTERATELTKTLLDLRFNNSKSILLHHRYPTSSENKLSQTHPIMVNSGSLKYKYLVVHNGILYNERVLREEHINELGFVYTTDRIKNRDKTDEKEEFNDSEAIAIEAAMFIEGQRKSIQAVGTIAFIALKIDKETEEIVEICFARNTNPLYMSATRGKLRLSSEGEGNQIKTDTLYTCNPKTLKFKKKKCVLGTSMCYSKASKGYVIGEGTKEEQDSNYSHVKNIGRGCLQSVVKREIDEAEEKEEAEKEEVEEMELMVHEKSQKLEEEIIVKVKGMIETILEDMYHEGPIKDNTEIIKDYLVNLTEEIEDIVVDNYQELGDAVTKEMLVYEEVTGANTILEEYEDKFTEEEEKAEAKEEIEEEIQAIVSDEETKTVFIWGLRQRKKMGLARE